MSGAHCASVWVGGLLTLVALAFLTAPTPVLFQRENRLSKKHCSQNGNKLNEKLVLKKLSKEIIQE